MSAIKPNFFIIGAPKCGTTALAQYLSTHPSILFSRPKEPLYFHTDFNQEHRDTLTWNDYLRCFDPERMGRPAVGEGTVWYLYSQAAVPNILDFNPDAKFIVMVRNPVDLAYSLHSQLLYGGHEDVERFATAWRLQAARRRGDRVPRTCPDAKALLYGDVAKVGEQIERLYARVPGNRVKVALLDDLQREPLRLYREVLDFLGLPLDERTAFPRLNSNRKIRRGGVTRALHLAWIVKRKLGLRRSYGVWRRLSPLLSQGGERRPLAADLRAELEAFFQDDVRTLARLIQRDLSDWCAGST